MSPSLSTTLSGSFDGVVERTRKVLSEQGFGVLTEIDVRATLHTELGEDIEDYLVLGACNPRLAHRALEVDRGIGVLLPCNVVVRREPEGQEVVVEVMNPRLMVDVVADSALEPIADEAASKLQAVIEALATD